MSEAPRSEISAREGVLWLTLARTPPIGVAGEFTWEWGLPRSRRVTSPPDYRLGPLYLVTG